MKMNVSLCLSFLTVILNAPTVSSLLQSGRPAVAQSSRDLVVQLAIFSGVPDPKWTVTSDSPFYDHIEKRLVHLNAGQLPAILGYKGFVVTMYQNGRQVIREVPRHADRDLENSLLDTAPSDLNADVKKMARKSINDPETTDSSI